NCVNSLAYCGWLASMRGNARASPRSRASTNSILSRVNSLSTSRRGAFAGVLRGILVIVRLLLALRPLLGLRSQLRRQNGARFLEAQAHSALGLAADLGDFFPLQSL